MTTYDPHPASSALADLDLSAISAAMDAGTLSSSALTRTLLERIGAIDHADSGPALRSVLAIDATAIESASARDEERASGRVRGPLHGVPVLLKDNIEAVGLPGTAGSLALAERTVASDSPLVTRLRQSGAVVLGATNLSEWANFRSPRSTSGWSAVGGLTGNPWALDRSAGGSSAGSGAAVAAGLAPVAIGTETNGSITCPAALNGIVGLKPTVGSVSTQQVVPISSHQDVPGPLTRSVLDAAVVYEVLSGRDDCVERCVPEAARPLRVGVVEAWLSGHAATDAMFATAVAALTPLVSSVSGIAVPPNDGQVLDDQVTVLIGDVRDDLDAYLSGRPGAGVRSVADVVAFNSAHPREELAHFGQEFLERAAAGTGRADEAYQAARQRNVEFARRACLGPAYEMADVLVAPAYQPAWKSDLVHGDQITGGGAVCTPPAILGWPILTVPMGLVDGLPVGISIVGQAGAEPLLLALGHAVEEALGLRASGALHPAWRPASRG